MNIFFAIILGIIQGLSEFLPISSSGHLVIFQNLFSFNEPPLTFTIMLHLGTLIAVVLYFKKDIYQLLKNPLNKTTILLIIGTLPAVFAGFFFYDRISGLFDSLLTVSLGLIITGVLLKLSDQWSKSHNKLPQYIEELTYKNALIIGFFQALAIVPGISRSGATITIGLFLGLEKESAARFSFLLSIPIIIGAVLFELKEFINKPFYFSLILPYIFGVIFSALFGYLAILYVLKLLKKNKLSIFSYYCWFIAAIAFAIYYIK